MGWQELQQAQILSGDERMPAWEIEVNLSAAGNSDWYLIPDKVDNISVTVSFTGGATGKVQTCTDKVDVIKNGTPVPVDWPFGLVAITTQKACWPPSGIRAVQVGAGTMKLSIRAN